MQAIQTAYKGYHFRSRLEARWAVFFDALGLAWEYEPEGFELPGVGRYLPDFRVTYPGRDAGEIHHNWFEVKASLSAITQPEWAKLLAFDDANGLVILDGAPDLRMYCSPRWVLAPETNEQAPVAPPYVPQGCAVQHIRFGHALWSHKGRLWVDHHENFFPEDWSGCQRTIQRAAVAARSARFEFGESGATL